MLPKHLWRGAVVGGLMLGGLTLPGETLAVGKNPAPTISVPAADARFQYEGRFDRTDPKAPVIIWEASRVRLDFSGDAVGLNFGQVQGQVCFNADVDGRKTLIDLQEIVPMRHAEISGLGAGRHHLVLFKRTEASAGSVAFLGVDLPAGAEAWPASMPHYATKMLFVGDSITVGARDEDGPEDQWQDRRTHNVAESYATLTAEAFNADDQIIALSGIGVAVGWYDQLMGDVWNRVFPRAESPLADLGAFEPATIFVNLGENDDSYSTAHKIPFPANHTSRYVDLVHALRKAYPKAEIVLLRGGMFGGAQSARLRGPWQAVVAQLEAEDPQVKHFVFTHWTHTHPRVADHRAMADELIAWLKAKT